MSGPEPGGSDSPRSGAQNTSNLPAQFERLALGVLPPLRIQYSKPTIFFPMTYLGPVHALSCQSFYRVLRQDFDDFSFFRYKI